MRVVSTFFPSSSILHSIKCNLNSEDVDHLVVAKPNKLEVYGLEENGVKLRCTREIWGSISSLNAIRVSDQDDEMLLVTTEAPKPLCIIYEYIYKKDEPASLREAHNLSLQAPFSRPMENFEGAIVHHSGNLAVIVTYVGKLKVLWVQDQGRISHFDCLVPELNVLSLCFLPESDSDVYLLAMLHLDHTQTLKLTIYEIDTKERSMNNVSEKYPAVTFNEDDLRVILPINACEEHPGGILVVGGQKILYFEYFENQEKNKGKGKRRKSSLSAPEDSNDPKAQIDWPLSDLTAYAFIDDTSSRILLGDKFGKLSLLSLERSKSDVSLSLTRLGETSPATTLTYLNDGVIFVGSHFGDSQIVRIAASQKPDVGVQLDILDTFKNLAPIVDAILIDPEKSGQSHIITCSGSHNTGSLRIIRNGADIEELATTDHVSYVKSLWPIRPHYSSTFDTLLALSTLQTTRFYALTPTSAGKLEELDESEIFGFSRDPTLAICNMSSIVQVGGKYSYDDSPFVVQVTSNMVLVVNLLTGTRETTWQDHGEIVAASVNPSQICVGLSGRRLVFLKVDEGKLVPVRSQVFPENQGEISSLSLMPSSSSLPFSNYVAVGFYESKSVLIFAANNLVSTVIPPIIVPQLPVSLLLCQFGASDSLNGVGGFPTHLLIGLGDGNLHVHGLSIPDGQMRLEDYKVIPVGSTRPVYLTPFRTSAQQANNCSYNVLAYGAMPTILYWDNKRLKHSPLVPKSISAACSLNSGQYTSSLAMAIVERKGKTEMSHLVIGRVRDLNKLHIQTVSLGLDNPVRISHYPDLRILCVGCQRIQPHRVGEAALESASVKFFDDSTFDQLHHFACELDEEVTVITTVSLNCDDRGYKTYVAVGTQYYKPGMVEASEGRILLFEGRPTGNISTGLIPDIAASYKTKGCVFSLADVQGRLVAAVNESVYILHLQPIEQGSTLPHTHPSGYELAVLQRWTHNYIVSNLVSHLDRIYIGDAVSSLSVLRWDDGAKKLFNVARDYAPLWPVSIETIGPEKIIGCNNDCNLFLFDINATDKRLGMAGNYYLGDSINKFIRGCLVHNNMDNGMKAECVFVTSSGRIGVISELNEKLSYEMTALQRNIGNLIIRSGGSDHSKWRTPKNNRGTSDFMEEATGFLDGDLLETFLDMPSGSSKASQVLQGYSDAERLNVSYGELKQALEHLQTLH